MSTDLSWAGAVQSRLEEIDRDLAARTPALEAAATAWFKAKRDREHRYAVAYLSAEGPVEARKAQANAATCMIGMEAEAEWEALKAVVRTLETRASIGQSLLRVGRA